MLLPHNILADWFTGILVFTILCQGKPWYYITKVSVYYSLQIEIQFLCKMNITCKIKNYDFRFPRDKPTRALWYKVCKLFAFDDVSNLRICWMHFTSKDYEAPNWRQLNMKPMLKPGSVPCRKKILVDEASVPLVIAPVCEIDPIDPISDSPPISESAVEPHFIILGN